jgi:ABC-type transporter Mla maintaining outer membrane lipid asymmetry ATPase subunit MlaF
MMSDDYQHHSSELDLSGDSETGNWPIRCMDVHKRLGGVPVLNGLNVAFPDDTITVVLGPSGTGKSVLIKHIIGLMFPDSGDVVVQGQSVPSLTMPKLLAMRRKIGVLFQDGALFGSMSVFDNVAFLDPVRTALLCELIQEMHSIHRGTYLVVTHNIASARQIGEYIALLWRGRIVEAGDAERMFTSENPFVRQFLSGSAEGPLTME